jgi:hypothetical protein
MRYIDLNGIHVFKETLENTEGAIKKGQSRETGNIGYTRRRSTNQKLNTICVGHHYTQINTDNVNKTRVLRCWRQVDLFHVSLNENKLVVTIFILVWKDTGKKKTLRGHKKIHGLLMHSGSIYCIFMRNLHSIIIF